MNSISLQKNNAMFILNNSNGNKTLESKNKPEVKRDIYERYPLRLAGFSNEVGAALSPILGPVGEMLSYIPSFTYIFMDIRDKYHRGENNDYEKTSKKKALEQLAFQLLASVILPTAAVKTSQEVANKVFDSRFFKPYKERIVETVSNNRGLDSFVSKFADKSHVNVESSLVRSAIKFQKYIEAMTVLPLFFKHRMNKSGLRNIGLAAVGLVTLGLVIKPIDNFVKHFVIAKGVNPLLDKVHQSRLKKKEKRNGENL